MEQGAGELRPSLPRGSLLGGALAAGALPFAAHFEVTEVVNGALVHYRDWVAIGGGALGLVLCAVAFIAVRNTVDSGRSRRLLFAALLSLLGGFQVARGLGAFAGVTTPAIEPAASTDPWPVTPAALVDPANDPLACPVAAACLALGDKLQAAGSPNAGFAYVRGCNLGSPQSCANAGDVLADDNMFPRALELYGKACDGGHGDSCSRAALLVADGKGATKDLARALSLLARGCDNRSKHACYNLGISMLEGEGVPADRARAQGYFAQACELGHAGGCSNQGAGLYTGEGARRDRKAAVKLLEKACSIADDKCFNLGVIYDDGIAVKRNPAKARELYDRACEAGSLRGCNNLGQMLSRAQGGPKDLPRAKLVLDKACAGGVAHACKSAAALARRTAK